MILDLTVVGQETGPIGGGAATMPATMPNQAVAAQQTNYGQAQVNPYAQQRAPVVQQAAPLCAPMASPSPYGQSVPMQTSPAPAAPSSYGSNAYSNNAYGGNTYGSGPVVRQDSSAPILPISAINPYSNK